MRCPPLLLAPSLVLLGCVADTADGASSGDADVVVIAEDVFYEPERIEVPAGEVVRLELRNEGGIVHDLVLDDGWESGHVQPGRAVTVELGPLTSSTTAWCSIPGHRDAGMELRVDVVAGPSPDEGRARPSGS